MNIEKSILFLLTSKEKSETETLIRRHQQIRSSRYILTKSHTWKTMMHCCEKLKAYVSGETLRYK